VAEREADAPEEGGAWEHVRLPVTTAEGRFGSLEDGGSDRCCGEANGGSGGDVWPETMALILFTLQYNEEQKEKGRGRIRTCLIPYRIVLYNVLCVN
jgi:hypothetical protein